MEKITDPVEIRDYNENGFVEFVAYKQPGYPGEWYGHFAFKDGESGQFIFTARKNSISFGDNTNTEHKYIYAETGAAQEPYIRYNVAGQYWEIYPTLGGGPGGPPGPILAEHTLLQNDIHTDTVTATPVEGDLIVANATPKWARFAKGAANQLLGVQASGATLEWKNIASLVSAGAGINVSGAATITISNTGVLSVNAMTGAISIIGTTNQVNVSSGGGTVTLSLPQNIHTAATPTFAGITLTGLTGVLIGNGASAASAVAATAGLQYLRRNAENTAYEFASISANDFPHNLLSAAHTDTVTATPVLGDIIVANSTLKWQRLAGNTTTTKKFLTQTGTGTQSALPAWDVIVDSDIPGTIVRTSRQILAGAGLSGGGDLSADRTLSWNGLTVRKNSGANIGTRRRLNFIEGSGISLSVSDDAVDDEVDITVTSTVSGGVTSLNGLTGALTLQGTQNQINVTSEGSTITLGLPQDIHANAVPVFGGLTLARDVNNNVTISFISGSTLVGEFLYAGINSPGSRYFGFIVRNADGFRIFTPNTNGSPVARIIVPNGDNVSVRIANGLVAGSGGVQIIGADGRIPALSSTYFASVDASALTNTLTVLKNSTPVGTRRQVNFIESTGTQWTVTDDGTSINLKAAVKRVIVLPIPGDPNAGAPVSVKVAAPTSGTITAIKHVCTVAASTTYTYDVNKNGATIYTNQSNRPTRTSAHGTDLVSAPIPDVTTFSEGDVFSIDLDVKGTGVKDVVFFVFYTET